jgi:hypothetical protein
MIEIIVDQNKVQLVEEKRKRNKERRLESKRIKKEAIERKQIEINDTKTKINEQINKLQTQLNDIQSKIKENSNIKNYNKVSFYKNIKKNIVYEIAIYNVKLTKLDENFIKRNMIRLKLCPKTEKGKECKYEECTYAHSVNDIRKPKCINHMFHICNFGNMCIHDHSNDELPEIPIKKEEILVEDDTLVLNNVDNGYKYVTIVNNICIYTDENSIELQKIKNSLNSVIISIDSE